MAVILAVIVLVGVGAAFWLSNRDTSEAIDPILATVAQGEFVSQVLDQGEVQSSENVEIRCQVASRGGSLSVLEVVPEGTRVSGGDFLVRLDSSSFEKELEQQKISLANAETAVIQAKAAVAIAQESKQEYLKGSFEEAKMTIENEINEAKNAIETAKQEMTQAKAVLDHSKKLQNKGFVTKQQRESDEFNLNKAVLTLEKAKNSLRLAELKGDVLVNITKKKELIQLDSDIEAANVKYRNEQSSLLVEKGQLEEVQTMIDRCTIKVPEGVSGQVVYAKESSRGGNDWVLEEGTSVRERQVLIRLPDPDKMEVKALINEQSITQIRPGMPCSINIDALPNANLKGIVTKVNQYAESSGWMSSSIRKYAVFCKILNPEKALKPGMNASVSIQVRYEEDALMAPLQAVYAVGEEAFCLVKEGDTDNYKTVKIDVDGDNSQMALITGGVSEGDQLVMNPGGFKHLMDLPETKMDAKIELGEGQQAEADQLKKTYDDKAKAQAAADADGPSKGDKKAGGKRGGPGGQAGGGRPGGQRGGGAGGFSMPENGAALIKSKDQDGDGKLTKDEAGTPYSYFFSRVDTDGDGFISEAEADVSIKSMKARMQSGGGGRPGGGGGQ